MRSNVPSVHIPDAVIALLERAANPADGGKRLCVELTQRIGEVRSAASVNVIDC